MEFVDKVDLVSDNMDSLLQAGKKLTPEVIGLLSKISSIDVPLLEKIVIASEKIEAARRDVLLVENGLSDIRTVAAMQNQVCNVSDRRDAVGSVAGSIQNIQAVLELGPSICSVNGLEPTLKTILSMKDSIENAILMAEDIESTSLIAESLRDEIGKTEIIQKEIEDKLARVEKALASAEIAAKRADERLEYIRTITERMNNFSVVVNHTEADKRASHSYNPTNNELTLRIPRGKTGKTGTGIRGGPGKPGIPGTAVNQGKKGEPGKNGTNFAPSAIGGNIDINKYNNYPVGFSFLNLDEIPAMIYFRKSNKTGDWTEGQPFGVSNGGYSEDGRGIDIVNGINIDELTTHILRNLKRREDGSTNSNSKS